MSVEIIRIPEWPYNKTTWARVRECCDAAKIDVAGFRRVCGNIGARLIERPTELLRPGGNAHDRKHEEFVDFGVLGRSAAWRQLLQAATDSRSQMSLFGATEGK